MSSYLLANHVFACRATDRIILLDLRHNKYIALDQDEDRVLTRCIEEWPKGDTPASGEDLNDGVARNVLRSLLDAELLTQDARAGRAASVPSIEAPSSSLPADVNLSGWLARSFHVMRLAAVAAKTRARLRYSTIERIVRKVVQRRLRFETGRSFDFETAERLVAVYQQFRPFLFTAREACLFDSLVLVDYLSLYGLFPRWVFGVQSAPFAAHAWVQQDGVVLNDTVERVGCYTPILAA